MALKILPALPAAAGKASGKLTPAKGGDIAALFASALAGASQIVALPRIDALGKLVLPQGEPGSGTTGDSAKVPGLLRARHDEVGAPATLAMTAHANAGVKPSKGDSAKDPPPKESPPLKAATATESPPPLQPQTAGQTIDFSGHILDAKPAKDIPAPQPAPQNDAQDLLARMVARAVNADRQRQAPGTASIQTSPASTHTANGVSGAVTAAFQHAIATAAATAQQQQQQSQHKQGNAQDQPQQSAPQVSSGTQTGAPLSAQPQPLVQTPVSQPAALTYSSIDPHAIVEQIVKGIVIRTGGSQTQVRLRLQPEHLGDVSLKLTVDGNSIAANVIAQNADVRDVLLANTQQLARSLAEAGLSLANFSVDVSGGNAGFTDQHSQPQHAPLKASALGSLLTGEDENSWANASAQPPVSATAQSLVLNHLV